MNKKLLALAVAGAMAAPLAANADVTIYGKVHMSVDAYDNGNATSSDGMGVSSNSSYIGFKGDEDLGNGLKTVWQIEQTIGMDEGTNSWSTRNTFLGLSGDFGTAVLGANMLTPYASFGRTFDVFGDTFGDTRNIMGNDPRNTNTLGNGDFDVRVDNAMVYISPNMNGLQFVGAYSADVTGPDANADDNDLDAVSVSATYTSGSLVIGGAYEEHESFDDTYGIRLGAKMGFGGTTVGFMWETMDGVGQTLGGAFDRDAWTFHVTQAFGANTVKLAYTTVDETADNQLDGADMWALGLDHAMSKRTTAYVMYAAMENEDGSSRDMAGGHGDVLQTGVDSNGKSADPHGFSIGLIHKF